MAKKLESKERNKILKTLKDWKKTRGRDSIEKILFSKILQARLAG